MRTIVEPKEHIDKLWGKQRIREDTTYRMMRYVLRVDYDGKVLLHNVVTGRLVLLEQGEAEVVDKLPQKYEPVMEWLVAEHYLVPESYDEHEQVVKLRTILWRLEKLQAKPGIVSYTILPTTACNARCYYCFEQGCKMTTMSEKTADDLVKFMASNCSDERKVFITWFGGEPTVASHRIDQICEGLLREGVDYSSSMITNGYLFDEEMVHKAKDLWRVQFLQICVDGTEESSNRIKAFVGVGDNPYQRVMRNIGLLLDNHITVGLRMNYDLMNYREFYDLCDEVYRRFGSSKYLIVAAHEIVGEYADSNGCVNHGSDEWFTDIQIRLREKARGLGLSRGEKPLPYMNIRICGACSDSCVVITPEGGIAKCPEQFGDEQIVGHITQGIINHELVDSWKKVADYRMCIGCALYPSCTRLVNCSNKTYCHLWKSFLQQYSKIMVNGYNNYQMGGMCDGVSGTKSGICSD